MKYWRWTVALALILTVAVSILAKQNGQNPPQSKDAENRIVEMLQEARKIKGEGDYSGAQALLERALTEAEKSLGPNHSMIAVLLIDHRRSASAQHLASEADDPKSAALAAGPRAAGGRSR